jgi:hypothetical protein
LPRKFLLKQQVIRNLRPDNGEYAYETNVAKNYFCTHNLKQNKIQC